MLISQTQQIADSALAKRLPTVYGYREHVVDDGLISYGVDSPASVSKKGGFSRHDERFAHPLGEPYHLYMGNSVPDFISY